MEEAFLKRLSAIAAEIDAEGVGADDEDDLDVEDESDVPADVRAGIDDLWSQRRRAFADIVQFLSDQYGLGPIDRLDDDQLIKLAREGCDAADNWESEAEMESIDAEPKTPLQHLLKRHYELGETILDMEDGAFGVGD